MVSTVRAGTVRTRLRRSCGGQEVASPGLDATDRPLVVGGVVRTDLSRQPGSLWAAKGDGLRVGWMTCGCWSRASSFVGR
jgi:hypothetical protein